MTSRLKLPTRRQLLAGTAAAFALPGLSRAATLDAVKQRGTLVVATEDDYQPFEFYKDNVLTGYDMELLALLAPHLPFKVNDNVVPWTGILPGVSTGKYDMAITAILVTKPRLQVLDFLSPVAESVNYYLKRAGDTKINAIKDLSGLKLGVEAGSAMLAQLPQLSAMLAKTGGTLGADPAISGLSGSLSGPRPRAHRLRGEHAVEPVFHPGRPAGRVRRRPAGLRTLLRRLGDAEGQYRAGGAVQQVAAEDPRRWFDVQVAAEMVQHHVRIDARATHRAFNNKRPMEEGDYLALLNGAWTTMAIALPAIAIGAPLGLGLALIRWRKLPVLDGVAAALVSLFRATPSVTLVLLIYYAVPQIGIQLAELPAAISPSRSAPWPIPAKYGAAPCWRFRATSMTRRWRWA